MGEIVKRSRVSCFMSVFSGETRLGVFGIRSVSESAGSEAPALLKVLVKAPQLLLFKASRSIIFSHPSTNQALPCLAIVGKLEIRCTQGVMARD